MSDQLRRDVQTLEKEVEGFKIIINGLVKALEQQSKINASVMNTEVAAGH